MRRYKLDKENTETLKVRSIKLFRAWITESTRLY